MNSHARLMPSKAGQWVYCPGSVLLQEQFPETGHNEAAAEGTAAHEVGSDVIADFIAYGRHNVVFDRSKYLDKAASNGVVISDEMLDAVAVYIHDVADTSRGYDGLSQVFLEHRVTMPMIHPENWGTLDNAVVWMNPHYKRWTITDFKYGYQIVEPWENWQLLDYVSGLIFDMAQRNWPMPDELELRIVQPRPYHPDGPARSWILPIGELTRYVDRLRDAAHEALGANPRTVPGDYCTHCSGRHKCNALLMSNYAAVTMLSGVTPTDMTPAALGAHIFMLRRIKKLVEAQLSGFEIQALSSIESGTPVPGWDWERTHGRKVWAKTLDEVYAIGDLLGKDLRKMSAPTPLQAIDMGIPPDIVESYSKQNPGKVQLTPASTKKSQAIFKQK